MLKELVKIKKLCKTLSATELQTLLIETIKKTQDKIDLLHDAEGSSNSEDKRFMFDGESITYTIIAEHILFINALKSVLVELVVYGKKHTSFTNTLYDKCDIYIKFIWHHTK